MHIKIVGFKCHIDTYYDFNSNTMTLLKGSSGAGKSTILQAVYWCLYGSLRGIYNNTGQSKKCSVTLKIERLTVYRQKRPELLRVTLDNGEDKNNIEDNVYEDTVAQQIIDLSFGKKELWKSCSYIEQKTRCLLLSGSASDRLELLNALSFDQDDPKQYISRIDAELKAVNKNFIELQSKFTAEVNLFSQQLESKPIKIKISRSDLANLNENIQKEEKEVQRLYKEVLDQERKTGSYNMILNSIKQNETKLNNLPNINPCNIKVIDILREEIEDLQKQTYAIKQYKDIKVERDLLIKRLDRISLQSSQISVKDVTVKDVKIDMNITDQIVWQTQQQENQYIKYSELAKSLNIEYNENVIKIEIQRIQSLIEHCRSMESKVNVYKQIKSLENKLSNYSETSQNKLKQYEQDYQKLSIEISEMKKGLELLLCPSCNASVRYINNKLIQGDRSPVDPKDITLEESNLNNIKILINKLREALSLDKQIQNLKSDLQNVDIKKYIDNPVDTNTLNCLLSSLSKIIMVEKPLYSSYILSKILENKKLTSQKEEIQNRLEKLILPDIEPKNTQEILDIKQTKLNKITSDYNSNIRIIAIQDQLSSNLENLYKDKIKLESEINRTIKSEYNDTKIKLELDRQKYKDGIYSIDMTDRQKVLEIERQKVVSLNNDLIGLQGLKQVSIETECKQLQETVDTINSSLSDILPLFFTEPITMILQLHKVLKTKKQIKPGLNISIKYKNTEYDNINQLSGGEGDRISLALLLALNNVSNSPIILLDECISSLDGALKESCVSVMKSFKGKTIVCVDHEGVEGFYDNTIQVNH